MDWNEAIRRINAGEPVADVIEQKLAEDHQRFRANLADMGPRGVEALRNYDQAIRNLDLGITGAQNAWHSLSAAQRHTLVTANDHDGRLDRIGKEYRHRDRHQPYRPIYAATVRNLCAHNLMAWDGGAFDPEAAAVVTERGQFVLRHGIKV